MDQEKTSQAAINSMALKLSGEDRMALLKKLSKNVSEKSYKLPKKDCKKCYGRGYIGYMNGLKSLPVPCRCVRIKPVLGKRK